MTLQAGTPSATTASDPSTPMQDATATQDTQDATPKQPMAGEELLPSFGDATMPAGVPIPSALTKGLENVDWNGFLEEVDDGQDKNDEQNVPEMQSEQETRGAEGGDLAPRAGEKEKETKVRGHKRQRVGSPNDEEMERMAPLEHRPIPYARLQRGTSGIPDATETPRYAAGQPPPPYPSTRDATTLRRQGETAAATENQHQQQEALEVDAQATVKALIQAMSTLAGDLRTRRLGTFETEVRTLPTQEQVTFLVGLASNVREAYGARMTEAWRAQQEDWTRGLTGGIAEGQARELAPARTSAAETTEGVEGMRTTVPPSATAPAPREPRPATWLKNALNDEGARTATEVLPSEQRPPPLPPRDTRPRNGRTTETSAAEGAGERKHPGAVHARQPVVMQDVFMDVDGDDDPEGAAANEWRSTMDSREERRAGKERAKEPEEQGQQQAETELQEDEEMAQDNEDVLVLTEEETERIRAARLKFHMTPTPERGFPEVHTQCPGDRLRGTVEGERGGWGEADEDVRLLVEVFRKTRVTMAEGLSMAAVICAVITALTGVPESEYVVESPAEPVNDAPNINDPADWFTYGLPPRGVRILLYQAHCSMPGMSLSFYPGKEPSLPKFMMGFTGFTYPNRRHIHGTVSTEFMSKPIIGWITELVRSNPDFAGIDEADAVDVAKGIVEKSLDIDYRKTQIKGQGLVLVTNLYMNSPTQSAQKWEEFRSKLRNHTKFAGTMKTTVTLPFMRCACCHGADHAEADCLYPHLAGWHNPAGDSASAAAGASQGAAGAQQQTTMNAPQAGGPMAGRGGGRGANNVFRGPTRAFYGAQGMGRGRGGPVRSQQYQNEVGARGRGSSRMGMGRQGGTWQGPS